MTRDVLFAKPNDSILKVSEDVTKYAISQMPVMHAMNRGRVAGTVAEQSIIGKQGSNIAAEKVKNIMDSPFPTVSEERNVDLIRAILEGHPGILVTRGKEVAGIIIVQTS